MSGRVEKSGETEMNSAPVNHASSLCAYSPADPHTFSNVIALIPELRTDTIQYFSECARSVTARARERNVRMRARSQGRLGERSWRRRRPPASPGVWCLEVYDILRCMMHSFMKTWTYADRRADRLGTYVQYVLYSHTCIMRM